MFVMWRNHTDKDSDFMKAFNSIAHKYAGQVSFSFADMTSNV